MDEAVRIAQAGFYQHQPQVVVGLNRSGAVAMNINSDDAKLVLLCQAWMKYGLAKTVKPGSVILHSGAGRRCAAFREQGTGQDQRTAYLHLDRGRDRSPAYGTRAAGENVEIVWKLNGRYTARWLERLSIHKDRFATPSGMEGQPMLLPCH